MAKEDIKRAIKELEGRSTKLLMELDSLENVIECSLGNYDFMIDFAIEKGFERVVDIGCAYGHQVALCSGRIKYLGIDEDEVNFYKDNTRKIRYEVEKYPFPNPYNVFKNDLAISNLAIGWACYGDDKDHLKQFKALKEDFKACLLYVPKDRELLLKEVFENVEIVKENKDKVLPTAFYYCY